MFELRWHGRGGQGSFTGAKLIGVASVIYQQRFAQAFPSFGPERRGAPVLGFNRISDMPITDRSEIYACDRMIFLDETLFNMAYLKDLKEGGRVLINTQKHIAHPSVICFDATGLALEILGRPIANTAMMGLLAASTPEEFDIEAIRKALASDLKPSLVEKNLALLDQAYESGLALCAALSFTESNTERS